MPPLGTITMIGCAASADLLHRIHDEVPAIKRLRFVTSYPRDFGDDMLEVMAASPRICRYLHVPAQSGSNRVLKRMNRGYTREVYLEFIEPRHVPAYRTSASPATSSSAFPTETDEDFEETLTLVEQVRFKNNFIFKYSPRPGTAAMSRLVDDVPDLVKRSRNHRVLELQARIGAEVHRAYVGQVVEVFVEQISRKSPRGRGNVELGWEPPAVQMSGRTSGDLIAVFDVPAELEAERLIGSLVSVRVSGSGPLLLSGLLIGHEIVRDPGNKGRIPEGVSSDHLAGQA